MARHALTCKCRVCRIRQVKSHRRPAVPASTISPAITAPAQQAAQAPFNSISPNIVNLQNGQPMPAQPGLTFNQTTTNYPSASQPGIGSNPPSTTNPTSVLAAAAQNTSVNFGRPQAFNFSAPSTGFSFNAAPSSSNPFSIPNAPSGNGNGGFIGSIFTFAPSPSPAAATASQPSKASTTSVFSVPPTINSQPSATIATGTTYQPSQAPASNVFAAPSTLKTQPSQSAQLPKPLYPGLANNNTTSSLSGQAQQGNGTTSKSTVTNGNNEDAPMMPISPNNSLVKASAEYVSGAFSPSYAPTEPPGSPTPITTSFPTSNTSLGQTKPSSNSMVSNRSTTTQHQTTASETSKIMAVSSATTSTSFGDKSQTKPVNTPQSGSNPFARIPMPANSITKDVSQTSNTSITTQTQLGKINSPTTTNGHTSLTGPIGNSVGLSKKIMAPSTVTTAGFTEVQQRHYQSLYQFLVLEASFKQQIASLPCGGDIDAISEDYWRKRSEIFGNGSSNGGLAGTKRKENDEISPGRSDSAKRSRINGPKHPIPHPLNHLAAEPTALITAGNTSVKRKAEDTLDVSTSKKARSEEPSKQQFQGFKPSVEQVQPSKTVSDPPLPTTDSKEKSETSALFNDILEKGDDETPSRPVSGFKPTLGGNQSAGSKVAAAGTTAPAIPFTFKPTAGAISGTSSTVVADTTAPANPFTFKSTAGAAFGTSSTITAATTVSANPFPFKSTAGAAFGTSSTITAATTVSADPFPFKSTAGAAFGTSSTITAATTVSANPFPFKSTAGATFGTSSTITAGTTVPTNPFPFKSTAGATFGTSSAITAGTTVPANPFPFKSTAGATFGTSSAITAGTTVPASTFNFKPTAGATFGTLSTVAAGTKVPASTFNFKPTAGATNGTSSTVAAATTVSASPFTFKPTAGATSETSSLKPPQLLPSTVNFMAQFGKKAKESEAEEKAKRKAAEFDSEEDNEEEWERKDAERQLAKRKKIEEDSKAMVSRFIPGKGFTWAPATEATSAPIYSGKSAPTSGFKPTFGAKNQSGSNSTATTTSASPITWRPTTGGLELPQPPSAVNFMAQFGKKAKESEAEEKAKRKAAEFDSEEDNEEEWERRDAEKQLAKRKKIEEDSKAMVSKFIPGKGFVMVPRYPQQGGEGKKDDVPQASTSGLSSATSGGLSSSNNHAGTSQQQAQPPNPSDASTAVSGSATSFAAPSNSEQPKAASATMFGAASGSNSTSVSGAPKVSTSFVSPFAPDTPSPSPPPSRGDSVFDQPQTLQQHKLEPNNIFAHLSGVEYGADNVNKAGYADDEGTETGEEDTDLEVQQAEHVEKAESSSKGITNGGSSEDTPKPAASGLSLFDRITRAEGDPRPLPNR
ncbi:MAG: hypothetical protein M1816_005679 [Peltula sp. TS41687]|nr:MAG: hypothetical protein M1816_005679 [Peltula sp. TS41687]